MSIIGRALGFMGGGAGPDNVRRVPSAIDTSFTYTGAGAAQANLYDGNDATNSADPSGLNDNTHAAYDFGSALSIRKVRTITAAINGFTNSTTFDIGYSDTSLTAGFTIVTTHVIPSGTSQETITSFADQGAHRYWRIYVHLPESGGNAWLGELDFYT